MLSANGIDALIMFCVGIFFTLLGYGVIKIGSKVPKWDVDRIQKLEKAKKLYRIAGPLAMFVGMILFIKQMM